MVTTEVDKNSSYEWNEMVLEKNNRIKSLEVSEGGSKKYVGRVCSELNEIGER